jgi:hypothetical protein
VRPYTYGTIYSDAPPYAADHWGRGRGNAQNGGNQAETGGGDKKGDDDRRLAASRDRRSRDGDRDQDPSRRRDSSRNASRRRSRHKDRPFSNRAGTRKFSLEDPVQLDPDPTMRHTCIPFVQVHTRRSNTTCSGKSVTV